MVISLQLFLNTGTVIATGVNKAFATRVDSVGWRTVTGIQFLFPVCKCALIRKAIQLSHF